MHRLCLIPLLLCFCVENRLTTYLLVQTENKSFRAKAGKEQIELSAPPLSLKLRIPTTEELEELSEELKQAPASKHYRLPPLTFLRFDFENRSAQPWRLGLSSTYFRSQNQVYGVITEAEYNRLFTSVAYANFRYEATFAAYITRSDGERPPENFWFRKYAPHETIEVKPGEAGFQILPFAFIPSGVEELVLYYRLESNSSKEKTLNVRLVTERS